MHVESVIKNTWGNICDIKLNSAWAFLWPWSQVPWSGYVCTSKLSASKTVRPRLNTAFWEQSLNWPDSQSVVWVSHPLFNFLYVHTAFFP